MTHSEFRFASDMMNKQHLAAQSGTFPLSVHLPSLVLMLIRLSFLSFGHHWMQSEWMITVAWVEV